MQLLLKDPRNGLQDSLTNLAKRLIDDEVSRRASPLLNMGLGEILGNKAGGGATSDLIGGAVDQLLKLKK